MFFFFFKQKTAYEITASDWSSDVCSSDLDAPPLDRKAGWREHPRGPPRPPDGPLHPHGPPRARWVLPQLRWPQLASPPALPRAARAVRPRRARATRRRPTQPTRFRYQTGGPADGSVASPGGDGLLRVTDRPARRDRRSPRAAGESGRREARGDRKSTRLNSSHSLLSRMPSS